MTDQDYELEDKEPEKSVFETEPEEVVTPVSEPVVEEELPKKSVKKSSKPKKTLEENPEPKQEPESKPEPFDWFIKGP